MAPQHHKTLIVIVGPTAIGKTSLSVDLAQKLDCEVISSDSRQFFKEMSIGTAKPTKEEMGGVPHHFVDFLSIHDEYSAGQFERDVHEKLDELFKTDDCAILVGGSGLYVNAVLHGFDDVPADKTIRKQLMKRLEEEGLESLAQELQRLDPDAADFIDFQNTQRVVRALEICKTAGVPYSSLRTKPSKELPFNVIKVGLTADREIIYSRINTRVDLMISDGLVDEARSLFEFREINALKTVGYRELFDHFSEKCTLEEAIELIKQNTRRFAKRQQTWFKREDDINWFDIEARDQVYPFIIEKLS